MYILMDTTMPRKGREENMMVVEKEEGPGAGTLGKHCCHQIKTYASRTEMAFSARIEHNFEGKKWNSPLSTRVTTKADHSL